ncbi:MAG: PHP domain-containing protein, partial [Acidimicrobiia bacterium]
MLKADLGVERVSDLIAAIDSGGAESLRGVGPSTAERWAEALALAPSTDAVPAFRAAVLASDLVRHLRRHLGGEVWPAGEVRRMEEWVATIDLVAGVDDVDGARNFLEATSVARFLGHGERDTVMLRPHDGTELLVHLVPPRRVGARLIEATGPPRHAESLLDAGGDEPLTEAEIYQRSGQVWVPPPARGLPIENAAAVVRLEHLRGDLHLHSTESPDGRMSLFEILSEAVDRGYEYVLITDHTSGLRFGGLDREGLIRQATEIEAIRPRFPDLAVFHGAELNIGRDGSLDVDDEALSRLDLAVAGVHSNFDLDRDEQTARVLTAMEHPVVRVLAHPTGRRIGTRPAIDLDIDALISTAVDNHVALEVNGHRDRLDLSAPLAARAVTAGALLSADSDSHRVGEMGNIANAVGTMQRAGVIPEAVVNTFPVARFMDWVGVFP